jgi:hypothetical protein
MTLLSIDRHVPAGGTNAFSGIVTFAPVRLDGWRLHHQTN